MDYYTAQYMWPPHMKYHKAHPLYAGLPEVLNPENLVPDDMDESDLELSDDEEDEDMDIHEHEL